MAETLRIEGSGKSIDLYPWLSNRVRGSEALAGIVGFGLPDITNQWFSGAGSGDSYRGSRVERRVISIPVQVYARNREELNRTLSDLSQALDPFIGKNYERGPARLFFGMPDDFEWYVDVARSGSADWSRKVDSDDKTFFKTVLRLEAGDAFWTREEPEDFSVARPPSTATLMPRIARLRVGSTTAFGKRTVTNVGDTFAWPVFTIYGPTTKVELRGPNNETLIWTGSLSSSQRLTIDMRANTVEDQSGANRYNGLSAAPRFWAIAPGESEVYVSADNSTVDTEVYAQWRPRRWAVV